MIFCNENVVKFFSFLRKVAVILMGLDRFYNRNQNLQKKSLIFTPSLYFEKHTPSIQSLMNSLNLSNVIYSRALKLMGMFGNISSHRNVNKVMDVKLM